MATPKPWRGHKPKASITAVGKRSSSACPNWFRSMSLRNPDSSSTSPRRDGGGTAAIRRHHFRLADPIWLRHESDAKFSRPSRRIVGAGQTRRQGWFGLHVDGHTARRPGVDDPDVHPDSDALGMVVVGLPYSFQGQISLNEILGGSPYGAATISVSDGSRKPSAVELEAARFQGQHVTMVAARLAGQASTAAPPRRRTA